MIQAPSRKVSAGALAGAITTVIAWIIETFTSVSIPAEIAVALTTIIYFVTSYFVVEPTQPTTTEPPPTPPT